MKVFEIAEKRAGSKYGSAGADAFNEARVR